MYYVGNLLGSLLMTKHGSSSCLGRFVSLGSVALTALLWPGVAGAATWQSAGTGDCLGHDVGFSRGNGPEAGRCDAKFVGLTAVCWAHGCTYKSVKTASCTGGINPGQMYTCSADAPRAVPPPPPSAAPTIVNWQPSGYGDCLGYDVAGSGGSQPDPSMCTAGFAGMTAVCWTSGCTYKKVATASCTGGASPGRMYTCGTAAVTPPPARPPRPLGPIVPSAPENGTWQPVGIGDCPGRAVSSSRGPIPDPGRCQASFAGNTAVCSAKGCSYKSVPAAVCKGRGKPGQMYTCVAAVPPPQPAAKPKPRGKHYSVVNYTGDVKSPHTFVVDWKACKVVEIGPEFERGAEDIVVEVCRPGSRLIMKTDFRATGTFIHYDWVLTDLGSTVAGAYCDATTCGPSVGKQTK